MNPLDNISAASCCALQWLQGRKPQVAIVLGSGLAEIANQLSGRISLAYADLPGFPESGVVGHSGQLHAGELFGCSVLMFQGRYHCYEGYSAWQVTAPVRLAAALGCQRLVLTNAAGGIADGMQPGDFMLVADHLNLSNKNPLRGRAELEFLDLGNLYQHDFYAALRPRLEGTGIRLHQGVLAWMLGPSYETPAEIRMLATLGADAVSMSTVPEAIVARLCQLETVAISFVANLAAGKNSAELDHQDVLAAGQNAASKLHALLKCLLKVWL